MPTGEHSVAARSIVYPVSNRHHSGVYTCSADNGFGEPVNGTVRDTNLYINWRRFVCLYVCGLF